MSEPSVAHDPPSWPWAVRTLVVLVLTIWLLVGVFAISRKLAPSSARAREEIESILQALAEYRGVHDKWPATLEALLVPDEHGHRPLEGDDGKLPLDPWGREYRYHPPAPEVYFPRVISFGADGKPGGSGEDADIEGPGSTMKK